MSDIPFGRPLLAAAPLGAGWDEPDELPLAALPCVRAPELGSRTPFLEAP